ncbi:putative disease resistance protein [Dichanthelium oligosanthes]|uniref:Putative disease resistance protein n=1 Tax=Dichanthelium oligosanthes TaxID=888268 RepID=A0A1E5VCL1_9POAL|nr:putative disease resistance protein [Dichanthelium oligosanthes]
MDRMLLEQLAQEALRELLGAVRGTLFCRSTAERLRRSVEPLLPLVQDLGPHNQRTAGELGELAARIRDALDLARRAAASPRWNVYRAAQLSRRMEAADRGIARWLERHAPAHVIGGVRRLRDEAEARIGRLERRVEEIAAAAHPPPPALSLPGASPPALSLPVAPPPLKGVPMQMPMPMAMDAPLAKASVDSPPLKGVAMPAKAGVMAMDMELTEGGEDEGMLRGGLKVAKEKVKEMVMSGGGGWEVVGISGMGGSGKTTLAMEIFRDHKVRAYYNDRIFFETISQSANLETIKMRLWEQISGNLVVGAYNQIPEWQLKLGPRDRGPVLVILDDVWSLSQLEDLVFKFPGCKTLVVSRFKFPTLARRTYEMQLLDEEEALSVFCRAAFDQECVPQTADKRLVKQVSAECRGLPLALKVIGASLRDQPPKIWLSAKNRLSRGEAISDSHETKLLERMAASVESLSEKVRDCFLDLGCFPEDKKIPLDVLINIWMEIHDLDEADAFAILVELSNKNLLTLVNDAQNKAGDLYSSYHDYSVTQHDVLRDLALHMSGHDPLNKRRRLVMPRREETLPRDWQRNKDTPFEAQIVSIHTGEMKESDWFQMSFPKAEVLILNFASSVYYLPPFIATMQNLKALVLINYGTTSTTLDNLSAFITLSGLRSLWLEKITLPPLPKTTIPLKNLRKISLVLCELNNSLRGSTMDLSMTFPRLSNLTIDHCIDLKELPSSICEIISLETISISNCHDLTELPYELGKLHCLSILRVYACPALWRLPPSVCSLKRLKYLDISQCINLTDLPEELGHLTNLEKIDMRECSRLRSLPRSSSSLKSLGHVVCDEETALLWREAEQVIPDLRVQVAEECYNLDWLVD